MHRLLNHFHLDPAEFVRVGVFVGLLVLLYGAAIWLLWRRRRRSPSTRIVGVCEGLVYPLALAGVGCIAYGCLVEPNWPEITYVQLPWPKRLAATSRDSRPVRLVQISDLHCVDRAGLEARLVELIEPLAPDVILYTGDGLNDETAMPQLEACLSGLSAIAPLYCVKGNWDMTWYTKRNFYDRFGCHELDGRSAYLTVRGTRLCITGASADDRDEIREAVRAVDRSAYCIFLYHYPDLIDEAFLARPDLYLAGHTHGGQIALPFYGALMTKSAFGKAYESGAHVIGGDTLLYVNRGIGMHTIPARFCARPEITVFDLTPAPR